jgi:hypothetical protein
MNKKYPPTHRPLSALSRARLQTLHEAHALALLQSALQTSAYTLARAKVGAPLLMSQASMLEQQIERFWERRAAA